MGAEAMLDRLRALAEECVADFGLELFDLEHRTSGRRWWFRVTLDCLEGPVTLDHCEKFSRELSARLDVEDLIPHAYNLEVSSPGLERPLRQSRDYERFAGQSARLVVGSDGDAPGGTIEGMLRGIRDGVVLVECKDEQVERIPLERIRRANLLFEFPSRR